MHMSPTKLVVALPDGRVGPELEFGQGFFDRKEEAQSATSDEGADMKKDEYGYYTFHEWCCAAGVWWRTNFKAHLTPPTLYRMWKNHVDPSMIRKTAEPFRDVLFVKGTGQPFRVVYAVVVPGTCELWLHSDDGEPLTEYLDMVRVPEGLLVDQGNRTYIEGSWKMYLRGEEIPPSRALPYHFDDAGQLTIKSGSGQSSDNGGDLKVKLGQKVTEADAALQRVTKAMVEVSAIPRTIFEGAGAGFSVNLQKALASDCGGDLQIKPGQQVSTEPVQHKTSGEVFERIHKVACSGCGDHDFSVIAAVEARMRAEVFGGRVVYRPTTMLANEKLMKPLRFRCNACKNEWPIPEALRGSVVQR